MQLNYNFRCSTERSKKGRPTKRCSTTKENCAALWDGRRLLIIFFIVPHRLWPEAYFLCCHIWRSAQSSRVLLQRRAHVPKPYSFQNFRGNWNCLKMFLIFQFYTLLCETKIKLFGMIQSMFTINYPSTNEYFWGTVSVQIFFIN